MAILWDVVSALHDSGWHEDDLPKAIPRLWKASIVEPRLSNLSSLSLPEDFVAADTIPVELSSLGPCEIAAFSSADAGTKRCESALRVCYLIPGERWMMAANAWPVGFVSNL